MITYTLLALITVFSVYCFYNKAAMNKYLFHPFSIYYGKEHYRFLTHAFIHGDWMHLAFNWIALLTFGLTLEEKFLPWIVAGNDEPTIQDFQLAKVYYIILFTGGIYAASVTEYIRNRKNESYSSLGASGAISSIIFCYIMIYPKGVIGMFFIRMPGWIFGLLLLAISYFLIMRKKKTDYNDNISHESHFWGAIFGIVFILIIKPSVFKEFLTQIFGNF